MQKTYKYNRRDFDNNGFHKDGKLFSDLMREWEIEFNKTFSPFFANNIFANSSTMLLLKNCFESTDNEDFGMDGEFDLETNLKIETHSKRKIIYAIGSELTGNEDEPLYLVIDDKISEGIVIFKYIPDGDEEAIGPTERIDAGITV